MRFITLTYLSERFSVNVERIAAIRDYNHSQFPRWKACIWFSGGEGDFMACNETREEVLQLINPDLRTQP